jgi:hypothetical protein
VLSWRLRLRNAAYTPTLLGCNRHLVVAWLKESLGLLSIVLITAPVFSGFVLIRLGDRRLHPMIVIINLGISLGVVESTSSVIFILLGWLIRETTHALRGLLIVAWAQLAWLLVQRVLIELLRVCDAKSWAFLNGVLSFRILWGRWWNFIFILLVEKRNPVDCISSGVHLHLLQNRHVLFRVNVSLLHHLKLWCIFPDATSVCWYLLPLQCKLDISLTVQNLNRWARGLLPFVYLASNLTVDIKFVSMFDVSWGDQQFPNILLARSSSYSITRDYVRFLLNLTFERTVSTLHPVLLASTKVGGWVVLRDHSAVWIGRQTWGGRFFFQSLWKKLWFSHLSITADVLSVLQVFGVNHYSVVFGLFQDFIHVLVVVLCLVLQRIWKHGEWGLVILRSRSPALSWEGVGILVLKIVALREPNAVPLSHFLIEFTLKFMIITSSFNLLATYHMHSALQQQQVQKSRATSYTLVQNLDDWYASTMRRGKGRTEHSFAVLSIISPIRLFRIEFRY